MPELVRLLVCSAFGMALAAGLGSAQAQGTADQAVPLIILHADNHYDVAEDGTFTQTYHFEFQPTNDASARREAQQAISFSPSLEDFTILDASTRKPDGRVLAVPDSAIHDQLPWSTPDLALFSDQRQKVIVFPEAAGGDTLSYTWRRVLRHPALPGAFVTNIYMGLGAPWRALDMTVTAPAAMHLHSEAHDMRADPPLAIAGDRVLLHWSASKAQSSDEPSAIGPYDRLPRVFVSSFSGYDAFAQAYAALALPKAKPTPAVRGLADTITAGVTDRRTQAKLLYDWVSLHVRYVAVYLNSGALEPHAADAVIADGYGDCKDHTVLFHALLAAKGIGAELVMINLGNHYTLSGPPTFAQLNHAISYLPEFDLYADTTAGTAPFGTLPFDEYGKPVVHAVLGEAAHRHALRRTPLLPPGLATIELRTVAHLGADGAITGTTRTLAGGPFSADLRRTALWAQARGTMGAAASQLRALGTEGVGAFAFPRPDELDHAFEMSGSFTLDPRPEIMEGDPFKAPVGLRVLVRPGDLLLEPLSARKLASSTPTPCYAGRQVEDLTLELPPERHLMRVPPDVDIDNAVLRYHAHWAMSGSTLMQHRELVSKVSTPLCEGETRQIAAAAMVAIRRDEKRAIMLADE